MKLSLATLAASVAVAAADPRSAAARWNNLRRRLSYEKIAGYAPDSQVRHRLIAVASERSVCNSRGGGCVQFYRCNKMLTSHASTDASTTNDQNR